MLRIEDFLIELREFFDDLLISGVRSLSSETLKKLNLYSNYSEHYNLMSLKKLIDDFISSGDERAKFLPSILIWLDTALLKFELITFNLEVNNEKIR